MESIPFLSKSTLTNLRLQLMNLKWQTSLRKHINENWSNFLIIK